MARPSRTPHAGALLALLSATAVHAQNDLPRQSPAADAASASDEPTAATTPASTAAASAEVTAESSAASTNTAETASTGASTASGTGFPATASSVPDATTATSAGSVFQLTGLPTIVGAGVPSLGIPYTANAPFMQKSSMPEGTVFIAIGAVLGFMGACVLVWRGLLAWSINRSVKRAAVAAMRGNEKTGWTGSAGAGATRKSAYFKEYEEVSTMSLDHLTSTGKTAKQGKHEDAARRKSSAPPASLFFSPTAQQGQRNSSYGLDGQRESTYLPAGYYASPSGEIAGGRNSTVIGGNLTPHVRHSGISPSPPGSPNLPNSRSTSNFQAGPYSSREATRHSSREGLRALPSRDSYAASRHSNVYPHPGSSSSLNVADSTNDLPGQRAPSAIFDEMMDNHGIGPRERF